MAFLVAENENRQLGGLPQAAFSCVPERFLLSLTTKSVTENFLYRKLRSCLFLQCFNAFFILIFTIFIRGLSILLFSFVDKVDFSCQ